MYDKLVSARIFSYSTTEWYFTSYTDGTHIDDGRLHDLPPERFLALGLLGLFSPIIFQLMMREKQFQGDKIQIFCIRR